MAWLKIYQSIRQHRKILDAADALEIAPPYMIGLLTSFWLWALDNAPDGNISEISARNIARAAQWDGDADELLQAFISAGLLDQGDEDPATLTIHDWEEYAGTLIQQREAEKERSRRRRAAAKKTEGRPPDRPAELYGQTRNKPRKEVPTVAWIQIHQQLKDHRKVLAAADELDIEPAHMLGLLISFWLWAIDNAPDGSLAGISDRMIARAAQWDKDPEEFVAALTSASLLDVTEDGVLEIHDWSEYTGKLIEQRENEKNRSRARRAAAKSNDRRTTAGQSADASKSDQKKTAGRVDQTRVDQNRPENKGDTPITPAAEKQPSAQERRFAEFWTAYPKKVGKKAAQKAWEKAKPDAELFEKIMQAVATAKTSEQWLREGGRFIPNPSTWINQGRWDDEPLPPAGSGSYQQRPGGNCGKPDTMDVLAGIIADEEGGFEI